ncbi:Nn.00g027620.m01.CDS01 [Neocucurbitaria sp. VM-36]
MADKKAKRTPDEKMMNGVRRDSMKRFEDLYAEPPPYSSQPPSVAASSSNAFTGGVPTRSIPSVDVLNFKSSPLEIPTPAECITHLKLLHAFAKLRHDVGNHEGLFGISTEKASKEAYASSQESEMLPPSGDQQPGGSHTQDPVRAAVKAHTAENTANTETTHAERLRDKRWTIFVAKAVARFEAWWDSLPRSYPHSSSVWRGYISTEDFDSTQTTLNLITRFPTEGNGFENNSKFQLPPLDILMVWHAHMLNPRIYLEDCIRYSKHALWRTPFPWRLIHESIDNDTLEYTQKDTYTFQKKTGHYWDPLRDEGLKRINCPQCACVMRVPWTQPSDLSGPGAVESYLTFDTGFAAPGFEVECSKCRLTVTHERLRVGKFIEDAYTLLELRRPLPGTILNIWGEPQCTTKGKSLGTHDAFFPNRVIATQARFKTASLREQAKDLTVEKLKNMFQQVMKSPFDLTYINASQKKPEFLAKGSRIAVRRLLSHYWDNSSIFGIDLIGAVLRHGTFVQKMSKLDWLHSPSIMSTVQRLIVKYHRFIRLAADSPKQTIVPTLDVDLAWHTHQLTPKVYYRYTLAETKKFLNHDDKIPESNLHTAFQATSLAYEKKYGQPYSECSCWYCECTREPLRSNFLNKFSPRRASLSVDKLDEKGFTKDAYLGPHVSAHNALVVDDDKTAKERRRELEELDLQYAKVVKRYQKKKKGEEVPRRDNDAYLYGAYGYPMYMPIYVPYYADPSACEHSSNGGGGGGGCVAATCCDSTSLGACAGGDGTPGCKASCGGHGNASAGCGTCGSGGDGGGDGGDGGGCGGCGG